MKLSQRKKALELRREGKTYSEILKQIPVAKSTLSLWLRDVGLSKPQKQRITKLRKEAQKKGAAARRTERLHRTEQIKKMAGKEVGQLSKRELWLLGVALYWAEGSKQKEYGNGQVSEPVSFANSDHRMIRVFIRWLYELCDVDVNRLKFGIYVHENNRYREAEIINHWAQTTGGGRRKI
ncbi:MAG: hypothetical protein WDZ79_00225 [Candidatus Paceibacterota bacterium]